MEGDGRTDKMMENSPSNSEKTISDDDEIDYSIKPEFYDPDLDAKDESWVNEKRKGRTSDAVLSCPACFTTLCLECQRHETYVTQYRAVFVVNCKTESNQVRQSILRPKRGRRGRESNETAAPVGGETFKPVCCSVCSTEVGVIDEDEVYHFYNVLPSES
ncbi:Eapp_C domain-containing protein [Cephalotus follicularis]|uniref:Eapp_C domain-containing protein n=1 Tax=Cephalotus follicularis TaxID=3775 RepID=A0A1Q3BWV3_CEPFO|nr:Eapp_C domain-containing protein [Cephalotus follicularis]